MPAADPFAPLRLLDQVLEQIDRLEDAAPEHPALDAARRAAEWARRRVRDDAFGTAAPPDDSVVPAPHVIRQWRRYDEARRDRTAALEDELRAARKELAETRAALEARTERLEHFESERVNETRAARLAVAYLDRRLRLRRFTPPMARLAGLRPDDIGRPMADLRFGIDYADLAADARRVFETLVPTEREVRGADDQRWYVARLFPYRTPDDGIDGVTLVLDDVTERVAAGRHLEAERRRLATLVRHLPVGVALVSAGGRLERCNAEAERLLGHPLDANAGITHVAHCYHAIHADDGRPYAPEDYPVYRAYTYGETVEREPMRYRRGDGRMLWLEVSAVPVPASDDGAMGAVVAFQDVTGARERAAREALLHGVSEVLRRGTDDERVLALVGRRLRRHFEVARAGFVRLDAKGHYAISAVGSVADGMPEVEGPRPLDACGPALTAALHRGETVTVADVRRDARCRAEPFDETGTRALLAVPLDGEGIPHTLLVLNHTTPRPWSRTDVRLAEEVAARVQEALRRLDVERALRRREALLRRTQELARLTSWEWHVAEDRGRATDEVHRLLGDDPATREAFMQQVHPEDRPRMEQLVERALRRGEPYETDVRLVDRDGAEHHVRISAEVELDAEGRPWRLVGFTHDITERRRLEQDYVRAAERESRRIGRELHDDLGQHLSGTAFLVGALAAELADAGDPRADQAARIDTALREGVRRIRALSRRLQPVVLEHDDLIGALVRLADEISVMYSVSCRLTADMAELDVDDETKLHLYRIAQEAVHNAVRHARADHVEIVLREADGLLLTVRDDGVGIDRARAESVGEGLGQHTMRYRAHTIGALLHVGEHPEGGTEVRCHLPHFPNH